MGLLKKLTKPLSKFLDKIVPNELKPALPYLSAFAPFMMGPGIMGAGGFQGALANPYMRALMSSGLNIGSQLSQEGSEGDFGILSALAAGATGFGTAAGANQALEGFRSPMGEWDPARTGLQKFRDRGLDYLGKGVDFLQDAQSTIRPGGKELGLNMDTLKAISEPLTHGTADLAMADAQRALRDFENTPTEDPLGVTDEGRRRAIRAAMEAGGHAEETILDALAALGLRSGGIVSLRDGGQLVKRGPGRPGYGGPHETEAAGRSYAAATSPGGGGGDAWQRQALKDFSKLSSTKSGGGGGGDTTTIPVEEIIKTKTINEPIGILANLKNLWTNWRNDDDDDVGGMIDTNINDSMKLVDLISTKNSPYKKAASSLYDHNQAILDQAKKLGYRSGGRIGLLRGGDPNDYPQQEDVGTFELQQEEGVPIGPMVKNEFESDMLSALKQAYDEAVKKGYKGSFRQFIQEQGSGIKAAQGGMMSVLPKGREADYRGGGVIPIGSRERADDVPARLSKNEFVMTADAVKAAGGGSVNRGAKKMYNLMHNLEARV